MTPDEVAAIKAAFSDSLEPVTRELRAIHETLQKQSELLRSIDDRLTQVEGNLDGVEILVRKRAG